jgi:hypothetical protein
MPPAKAMFPRTTCDGAAGANVKLAPAHITAAKTFEKRIECGMGWRTRDCSSRFLQQAVSHCVYVTYDTWLRVTCVTRGGQEDK